MSAGAGGEGVGSGEWNLRLVLISLAEHEKPANHANDTNAAAFYSRDSCDSQAPLSATFSIEALCWHGAGVSARRQVDATLISRRSLARWELCQ